MTVELSLYIPLTNRIIGIINNNKHLPIEDLPSVISVATDLQAIVSCYFVKVICNTDKIDSTIVMLKDFYKYDIINGEEELKNAIRKCQPESQKITD